MISTKFDATENRALIKLRNRVISARARWEKIAKKHSVAKRPATGKNERSQAKILYIAHYGKWFDEMKKEILVLQNKIKKAGYVGAKKPRTLWLPTVIENPRKIQLNIYPAQSVRKITAIQARRFIKKAGCETNISRNGQYVLKSFTGRNYKIRVTYGQESNDVRFTEWALCIYHKESSLPPLRRRKEQLSDFGSEHKGAICSYKNSALYLK